ncbi:MAG: 50S ribosomal protein L28 [Saprospiraceae bacterium]
MSRVCELTGKRPISGNKVSHSNRKTRRRFLPNLQKKRFFVPETGEWITLKVSANAMRTINKIGLTAFINKAKQKGTYTGVEWERELGC